MDDITTGEAMTLLELSRQTGPDGKLIRPVDIAIKKNEWASYAKFMEANDQASHTYVQLIQKPTGAWRSVNENITRSQGRSRQAVERIKMLEDENVIDEAIIDIHQNPKQFRATQDDIFQAGLFATLAEAFIYGNEDEDPDELHGLASRDDWNALADTNIVNAGGSGSDVMSVWVIKFGMGGVYFVYPKGSTLGGSSDDKGYGSVGFGMYRKDRGIQRVNASTSSTNAYYAYTTHHKIKLGLVCENPRCVQRICNIESSGSSNILDPDMIVDAIANMDDTEGAVILMNRTAFAQLRKNAMNRVNVFYDPDKPWGNGMTQVFDNMPLVLTDALAIDEDALT